MDVEIRRSKRRQKTIEIRLKGDRIEVLAPDDISDKDLDAHIARFRSRVERRRSRDDSHLEQRATQLNMKYLGGAVSWKSISYSDRMEKRYGSCTPSDGTIRISSRLRSMPVWVEDYVIVHELAHMIEPNHGPRFRSLVNRYPLAERARGFLMAMDMCRRKRAQT
ncbi:M48 family metallopeptidase [Methanothrix sp.]|uniref:M48 metallopeptidase family protein n=1 Tax=Methanothrix sp. TaxID=90426 RepID=UPI003C7679C3